jgi:hypothetical protein
LNNFGSVRVKISPSPPFDYAQDMLFRSGVKTATEKVSPLKKGGLRGI